LNGTADLGLKAPDGALYPRRMRVVGLSQMAVSQDPREVLITYSLGSCIGLSLHDPEAGVGGLIHCMMPLSRSDPARAEREPCVYVDTGVVALLQAVFDLGASRAGLVVKVAGGATSFEDGSPLNVGKRNYAVLRKILWKNDILIGAEDVGGRKPRTMALYMNSGITTVKTGGRERTLEGR